MCGIRGFCGDHDVSSQLRLQHRTVQILRTKVSVCCVLILSVCLDYPLRVSMQREFEERRNAEYVEVQRLEEQERRRTEEKVL